MTPFAHPLNANRICAVCERGEHRNCRNPLCECLAGRTVHHHANRPPRPKGSRMEPATVTPITKNKPAVPQVALRKVDELPDDTRRGLADRVAAELAANLLEPGSWYELVTYKSRVGAGGVATRLTKKLGDNYDFAGRGNTVYVRIREA